MRDLQGRQNSLESSILFTLVVSSVIFNDEVLDTVEQSDDAPETSSLSQKKVRLPKSFVKKKKPAQHANGGQTFLFFRALIRELQVSPPVRQFSVAAELLENLTVRLGPGVVHDGCYRSAGPPSRRASHCTQRVARA